MKSLLRSVAGVRGIWKEDWSLEDVIQYAAAFGMYLNSGRVVVGRDTRVTGEMISHAAVAALVSTGCSVTDIGVVPTPTCQLMVETSEASGGIVITASHNPVQWNGLKFLDENGHFFNQPAFNRLIEIIDRKQDATVSYEKLKPVDSEANQEAIQRHIDAICSHIDVEQIRKKQFKVALDAVNGAGSRMIIPFLQNLNCEVIPLYCDESGIFPREPEPMAEHIGGLCNLVVGKKADVGFAVDPDADRLSVVTEKGEALGEEMTLPLVARHLLPEKKGVVVTNLSTSMTIDYVAGLFKTRVIRSRIGEAHVVSAMKENDCHVGGEGNGGIIVPEIHYARDTGAGIGYLLEWMSQHQDSLSDLVADIPRYVLIKKKMDCPIERIPAILDQLKNEFSDADIDDTDGVKLLWKEAWLHIRKSGTEGLLRIFAEAKTADEANRLIKKCMELIRSVISS